MHNQKYLIMIERKQKEKWRTICLLKWSHNQIILTFVVDIVIAEVVLEFWQNEYESESNPKPGRSGPAYKMLMGSLLIE